MSDNDDGDWTGYGEGENWFSSYKVGGPEKNLYGPSAPTIPNPGVKTTRKTDSNGRPLFRIDGTPDEVVELQPNFVDGSDAYANQGFTISFQSVINDKTTVFKAFITAFNETYNSNWTSEEVFGRADPIHMFKNTTRNITLSFMVPASTEGEAYENITKTQELIQKLYPAYTNVQGAQTIAQSPLVRMKVVNMTQRAVPGTGDVQGFGDPSPDFMLMSADASDGLLGIIKNVSINHHLDDPNTGVFEIDRGVILPKLIEIQIEFSAIHEMPLAQEHSWNTDDRTQDFETFPYGYSSPISSPKSLVQSDMDKLFSAWTKKSEDEREDALAEELADQCRENAEARYAGLFGKARFNKDMNRLQNGSIKNDEKRNYIASAALGEQMNRDPELDYDTATENAIDYYEEPEYDMYGELINY